MVPRRCKPSIGTPCPCYVTFTGLTPGCRQYLQITVERDQWDGSASVSTLTINDVAVPTSYFPCVPTVPNTVRAHTAAGAGALIGGGRGGTLLGCTGSVV